MSRKRYRKNPVKTALHTLVSGTVEVSPAAQAIMQRIANGGVDYMKDNLIRIMNDSAQLADEPEFIDLYLDGEKTVDVSERWLKKYEKRLTAAQKKGPDQTHQVVDEMRIDVLAELATPAFRADVAQRLQALLERLMTSDELEKLEIAIMLQPMLSAPAIPWGICSLILEIYTRSMERGMQVLEDEVTIFEAMQNALKDVGATDDDLFELMEHPEKLEKVAQELFGSQPDLLERAEEHAWQTIHAFEDALGQGNVELKLYSDEELDMPFQRLYAEYGEVTAQVPLSAEMQERIYAAILQAIAEIMTPERIRRLRDDIAGIVNSWFRARHKWAAALELELSELQSDQYEENRFFMAAFMGQLVRRRSEHAAPKRKKRR